MVEPENPDAATSIQKPSTLALQPVIQEIIRTQFCPAVRLLVDKINVVRYGEGDDGPGAYRLWLSDGEKSIQALLRREFHPFLASREVQDGSIVLITSYRLTKAKKLSGYGQVWLLLIDNLHSVGVDGRESHEYATERRSKADSRSNRLASPKDPSSKGDSFSQLLEGLNDETGSDEPDDRPPSPSEAALRRKRRNDQAKHPATSKEGAPEPVEQANQISATDLKPPPTSNPALRPITRPFKVMPLASLVGSRATRNRIVDVVGIIVDVSSSLTQRPKMPDQRDLRIMDPSTTKRVQLTVFVDAANFKPAIGTVALFRSVTTHEWNGGSLKAYPRDCEGKDWYFPNPELEGLEADEFRAWWLRIIEKEEAAKAELEKQS